MELIDAPRGPCSDEGIESIDTGFSLLRPSIDDSSVEAILDSIVGGLVLPQPLDHKSISHGFFVKFQDEIDLLHKEVQFCIWSMNIALSVYMQLLNFVDISVRMEISNVVSQRLSEWKGAIDTTLTNILDELIISEFKKHALTDIPNMEHLQRNTNSHILCSTVACYIKDIAIKLYAMHQCDIESTIEVIFPPSKNFIGRCFFPRLASVSSKLLELIKSSESEPSSNSLDSINSTLFSGSAENSTSDIPTQFQTQLQSQINSQLQSQLQSQIRTQIQTHRPHFRIS